MFSHSVLKPTGSYVRRKERDNGVGWTESGRLAVLHNVMLPLGNALRQLLVDLKDVNPDNFLINGRIWTVATGLQNVLDAIAVYCDSCAPYDDIKTSLIYFATYPFPQPAIQEFMPKLQKQMASRTYGDTSFFEIANGLKHNYPYVGNVTCNVNNEVRDVWKDGVGFVYDILVPTYKDTQTMFEQLNNQLADKIKIDLPKLG